MIILSNEVLFQPEATILASLGESSKGEYVYKTDNVNFVKEFNGGKVVKVASQEEIKELRKTLLLAREIDSATARVIRSKYSVESELGAIRRNDSEYKAFIEEVLAKHNAAKDALFSI